MEWIFPNTPLSDYLPGIFNALAVPSLSSHNHNAAVFARRLNHPFAFVNEECHRLFYIDVLAGLARQNGMQRVPMVGRRNHHAWISLFSNIFRKSL